MKAAKREKTVKDIHLAHVQIEKPVLKVEKKSPSSAAFVHRLAVAVLASIFRYTIIVELYRKNKKNSL